MDQNNQHLAKWEGKVSARLVKSTVDQIWSLFTDFFNIHKWLPGMETCYGVHGDNGEPGCIRYCAFGLAKSSSDDAVHDEKDKPYGWLNERLIALDHDEHTLIYEVLENNMGFESYVSTVKVVPTNDEDGPRGCAVEWSFTVEPMEGRTLDDLLRQFNEWLHLIVNKMEASLTNLE